MTLQAISVVVGGEKRIDNNYWSSNVVEALPKTTLKQDIIGIRTSKSVTNQVCDSLSKRGAIFNDDHDVLESVVGAHFFVPLAADTWKA